MSEHLEHEEFLDSDTKQLLGNRYAAPAQESYWSDLEARVMARIRAEMERTWWSYFPGWVRYGVAAAAVVACMVGVASWQTRVAQERIAMQELLGTPAEIPLLSESIDTVPVAERARTLRYLLTH